MMCCKYVATVRQYSKSLNWYCVQILKLGECVCGCRCMHASGTLKCSIADVVSLIWDSCLEKPGHMRQCSLKSLCIIFYSISLPKLLLTKARRTWKTDKPLSDMSDHSIMWKFKIGKCLCLLGGDGWHVYCTFGITRCH